MRSQCITKLTTFHRVLAPIEHSFFTGRKLCRVLAFLTYALKRSAFGVQQQFNMRQRASESNKISHQPCHIPRATVPPKLKLVILPLIYLFLRQCDPHRSGRVRGFLLPRFRWGIQHWGFISFHPCFYLFHLVRVLWTFRTHIAQVIPGVSQNVIPNYCAQRPRCGHICLNYDDQ